MKDKIKTDILNKYRQIKEQLGHKPSSTEFLKLCGIDNAKRNLQKIFGNKSYSKLVEAAGDEPNIFFRPGKSTNDLLIIWGNMVRKLGRLPGEADWLYHKFEPSADWFRKKFGGLPKIPERFREFAKGKKEWEDVLVFLPKPILEQVEIRDNVVDEEGNDQGYMNNFLPPVISNLCELGNSEGKSLEYEKKVGRAFEMLGFEVELLGQGSGRNPDGIGYDKKNHYAIIYDAKARKDGYSFGADVRAIIEYINDNKSKLDDKGFNKIYFLIISNKFNAYSKDSLNRIIRATQIPVILVKTKDLLNLVSSHIRYPVKFDRLALQDLFIESGELDQKKVRKFTG